MLTVAVFLGVVVALTSACCTPDQWEGGQGGEIGYAGFIHKGLIREYLDVAYDAKNKRSAATLYYRNGEIKGKFKMVVRYDDDDVENDEGKLYFADLDKGKCWIKTLKKPFRKACIPKEAKEMGDYYLGLKGGLKATSYELDGEKFSATVSVSKLDNGQCIPIGEIIASKKGRFSTLRNMGFVNITPGIKNATVFDVPKSCEDDGIYSGFKEIYERTDFILAL